MQEFLVALTPTDDGSGWLARWQIRRDAPGLAVSLSSPVQQEFSAKIDAVQWLDQEGSRRGFTVMIPNDMETRAFLAVAIIHGH